MARRKKGNRVHGWVFLDKPLGLGSTQAVSMVRRAFNAQKAGHAGTLDPLATGLLAIALGEATKTVPYMMDADKAYTFTMRWGEATTTCDVEGEVCDTSPARPSRSDIEKALSAFVGDIEQAPPAYSAIKIDGQRAYDLARAGKQVEMKKRPVHIESLKLVEAIDEDHASFEIICGKGTYVRSLARDLAIALGTCGHVTALRRIATGGITISQCIDITALEHPEQLSGSLIPLETVLCHLPTISLSVAQTMAVNHGNPITLDPDQQMHCGDDVALLMHAENPVALAHITGPDIRPFRVFDLSE